MRTLSTILPKASSAFSYAKGLYTKTKDAVLFRNQPMVNLGWQYKTAEGLKEATLPLNVVKNMPKIAKGILIGTLLTGAIGGAYGYYERENAKNAVEGNIKKAKENAEEVEEIIFDEKIPLPAKLAIATKNSTTPAGRFYNALKDNKENLMNDLSLSSDDYNKLAVLALRLSREESSYGSGKKYKVLSEIYSYEVPSGIASGARIAREMGKRVVNDILKFDFSSVKEDFKPQKEDGALSLGMTAFKISNAANEEKALFNKYHITYEDNQSNIIDNPEQSAIATLIHMATLKKLYPVYLENAKSYMPDLNDPQVKQSIKNAQRVLFNDQLRPMAITDLREGYYLSPGLDDRDADEENMRGMGYCSRRTIEDLKVYARTVILSPEAHLIAMWNGRGVIPNPNKSRKALDETYINLLHVAAQKGYIANMDKKSHVIYDI